MNIHAEKCAKIVYDHPDYGYDADSGWRLGELRIPPRSSKYRIQHRAFQRCRDLSVLGAKMHCCQEIHDCCCENPMAWMAHYIASYPWPNKRILGLDKAPDDDANDALSRDWVLHNGEYSHRLDTCVPGTPSIPYPPSSSFLRRLIHQQEGV